MNIQNTMVDEMSLSRTCKNKAVKNKNLRMMENLELLLLTLPALICFTIFNYLPMFGTILAFKDFRYNLGILGSKWVGFKNFEFFFFSQDAWRITRNTVGYGVVFIVMGIICSVFVALLLFEVTNKVSIKIYQTTMILPYFLSWVIVGYITYALLNPSQGVINQLLKMIGAKPISWYAEPQYWPFILTVVNIWKTVGLNCIIYYASLMGINYELFEAAIIDGANRVQKTWYISIPSLIPLMTILSILAIGNLFRGDFGLFYQIPRDVGTLYPVTDIIDTYVYRGLRNGNIGMTTAVGLFQSVVGLILVVITNYIVKRINSDNSLY